MWWPPERDNLPTYFSSHFPTNVWPEGFISTRMATRHHRRQDRNHLASSICTTFFSYRASETTPNAIRTPHVLWALKIPGKNGCSWHARTRLPRHGPSHGWWAIIHGTHLGQTLFISNLQKSPPCQKGSFFRRPATFYRETFTITHTVNVLWIIVTSNLAAKIRGTKNGKALNKRSGQFSSINSLDCSCVRVVLHGDWTKYSCNWGENRQKKHETNYMTDWKEQSH